MPQIGLNVFQYTILTLSELNYREVGCLRPVFAMSPRSQIFRADFSFLEIKTILMLLLHITKLCANILKSFKKGGLP